MTLPAPVSNCLWLRQLLKQKFLLCICQLLMHFLSISISSFPHECLAFTAPCGQELHSPLHLSLLGLFLTLSDAPKMFYWEESNQSIPAHPPHPSQGFIFDPIHGWSALTWLLFTRKLFHTFDHLHCFLWTFIQFHFFWQEGKKLHSLKDVVHNRMCSKDILYLLTLEIQIALLTSSEYCRSWN